VRRLAIFLSALLFVPLAPQGAGAQQGSKESNNTKTDSGTKSEGVAERLAEHLSRTLPEKLSELSSLNQARIPAITKISSLNTLQNRTMINRESDISVDLSQDPADRPKIQMPDEKPLGAAGPSRDKSKPETEDAEFMKVEDRWRVGVPEDPRFRKGSIFNPYRQNVLKGDYPIIGNDIFMNLTFASESRYEIRGLPVGQNAKNPKRPGVEFFGRPQQQAFNQNFIMSFDMFKGDASFAPVKWRFKITGIANLNYLGTSETTIVNLDPNFGSSRLDGFNSIEEAFFEYRIGDTTKIMPFLRGKDSQNGRSPEFDFTSVRVGVQEFNNDFRGFLFFDKNLGARMFGTIKSNRYQYNLAYFNLLEKETNSGLNTSNFRKIRLRDQQLYFANVYRQDTFVKGYTLQGSLTYSFDQGGLDRITNEKGQDQFIKLDLNGFQVRPSLLGVTPPPNRRIRTGYFGVAGDGHFGRLNITHQFYQAIGRDDFNGIAGKAQRINSQLGAAELSIDYDYIRYRVAAFYTSGDSNLNDNTARGFDAIQDNPNFAGGQFSFFNSGFLPLRNSVVGLVQPTSLIPSLKLSKTQSQANFINPGVALYNFGVDVDLTPKLRGFFNYNYIRFNRTEPIEFALSQKFIPHELGHDIGLGFIYRPLLNENIVITGGASTLKGGPAYTAIYSSNCDGIPTGCAGGKITPYSVFSKVKFQY
jgi:hypothetical protein